MLNIQKPQEVTYLSLGETTISCRINDALYMVINNTLYEIKDKVVYSLADSVDAKVICQHGTQLLIITNQAIKVYEPNTDKFSVITSEYTIKKSDTVKAYSDGKLMVLLINKTVYILNPNGKIFNSVSIDGFLNDVYFFKNKLYVAGYRNQKNQGTPVQSAFVNCYKITPNAITLEWKSFGFTGNQLESDMADTRIYKVTGNGNYIAILGESAGGNTAFRWNGKDLKTPKLVTFDDYNDPSNSKDAHILYYALLDPNSGYVIRGQFSIPRNTTKKNVSNTNRDRTIFLDSDNTLYIGSLAAYLINSDERSKNKILNVPPRPYKDGDACLLQVPQDMKSRLWFTPGHGEVSLFDSHYCLINTDVNTMPTSKFNAKSKLKPTETDTYLIKW